MTELHEILYFSTLAPGQKPTVVGQIVSQARARNAGHDVTGLLVFDGQYFCQHIEGPRDQLSRLMDRIGHDARHCDIRVVYEGALAERRYQRFDMGFADVEGPTGVADLHRLDGAAALEHFLARRPHFDVSG
ncbi:BLUF domain-containing protein [Variovorax sp. PAMC 28711]|uniref:BLUF domain-containing protein n=1 Tax=Variovorax sp. PAMC 28711 TaxID=1795631 RepID=UPI00078BC988|nr:BLUF domain-containing protein [Variovorax sp. PAMC 28711]AMM23988.1 blue light sensor protein [Variovorax sp. PAMC 28711]